MEADKWSEYLLDTWCFSVETSIIGSSKDLEEDVVVEPALAQEGGEGQTSKQRKTESHSKSGRVSL